MIERLPLLEWIRPSLPLPPNLLPHTKVRSSVAVPDPSNSGQPDPDPGSKKSAKNMENFHKNQPKSSKILNLSITDMNIYPTNNRTDHIFIRL